MRGIFSEDFTFVFKDVLGGLFEDGFPSQSGQAPDPKAFVEAPEVLDALPLGMPTDEFEFDALVSEPTTESPSENLEVSGNTAIEAEVAPMNMGPPDGGPGGGNGGGGNGGGKPSDPAPTVSETTETAVLDVGNAVELSGDNFYFSSDGVARDGDALNNVSGFDIALEFVGDWNSTLAQTWQTALQNSADFFTAFITEGLSIPTTDGTMADAFITDGSVYWDDLWITVSFADLDPGILASAGPSSFWGSAAGTTSGLMPALGNMTIATSAPMDLGVATLIATHEMMHVLGFGTIWDSAIVGHDLLNGRGVYTGDTASDAFDQEFVQDSGGRAPSLSVETSGGAGTAGGHWEDGIAVSTPGKYDFADELMTGYIDLDNPQNVYLSDTSLAVLEDLGYTVAWNVDYTHDNYDFNYA